MDAIRSRRSIRRFRSDPLPREIVNRLLEAACLAPSSKNAQPWRFVVFQGPKRLELLALVRRVLGGRQGTRSSPSDVDNTLRAMEAAPVVLLVFMAKVGPSLPADYQGLSQLADIQSIGASIQNLLLAAVDYGLGALWIGDILDASEVIQAFAGRTETLVAAVALGYAAEAPNAATSASPARVCVLDGVSRASLGLDCVS